MTYPFLLASGSWIPNWVVFSVLAIIFLGIPALILFLVNKFGSRTTTGEPLVTPFRKRDWILMGVVMLLGWQVDSAIDSHRYVTLMNQATANGTEQQAWQEWHLSRPSLVRYFILLIIAIGGAIMVKRSQQRLGSRMTWWCLTLFATLAFIQCIAILERLWHGV